MSSPRILIASPYNLSRTLFGGLTFDFCQVLRDAADADLIASGSRYGGLARPAVETASALRRMFGLSRRSLMDPVEVDGEYDLFFYVCMSPRDLAHLKAIQNWRQKSKRSAAIIIEIWSSQLAREAAQLKMLDAFDQVFVFNRAALGAIQSFTETQCTFMVPGADCLSAAPVSLDGDRPIDVYSMGRRSPHTHRQLMEMARRSEIFYVYDIGSGLQVRDFAQARYATWNTIKRSRYFISYNHSVGPKAAESAGEQALPMRLFEGAAGGSVMLGSGPDCTEFDEAFDWQDAVIPVSSEPSSMRSVLAELDADPGRLRRARYQNATQSLLRHDWAYRWEQAIQTLGYEAPAGIEDRKRQLRLAADRLEGEFRSPTT